MTSEKKIDLAALGEVALEVLRGDLEKYVELGGEAWARLKPVADLAVHAAERQAAGHPDASRDLEYAQAHLQVLISIYSRETSRQAVKTALRVLEAVVGTLARVLLRGLVP